MPTYAKSYVRGATVEDWRTQPCEADQERDLAVEQDLGTLAGAAVGDRRRARRGREAGLRRGVEQAGAVESLPLLERQDRVRRRGSEAAVVVAGKEVAERDQTLLRGLDRRVGRRKFQLRRLCDGDIGGFEEPTLRGSRNRSVIGPLVKTPGNMPAVAAASTSSRTFFVPCSRVSVWTSSDSLASMLSGFGPFAKAC